MSIFRKIKRAIRGEVAPTTVVREVIKRSHASIRQKRERRSLAQQANETARLQRQFAQMLPAELLEHFQRRTQPHFFSGFDSPLNSIADSQRRLFPEETEDLIIGAERIVNEQCWPLLGLGDTHFGKPLNWHRDLVSGFIWPLDYCAEIKLNRDDNSDVRFVWELNRLGHLLTLARAYVVTTDQRFSEEFVSQVESWQSSNPLGRGVNWNCAMEVALRAMNLLGAFAVFRHAPEFDEEKLARLLIIFDQHGRFIREHLEFSYIATSNHYLSDVTGLLWLGIMLPELEQAEEWRAFGLREMLREMDKQVLADGADFESSTGYHRFVLELFLYSFVLARANAIEIAAHYWEKLHKMLRYARAYLRPDGYAPLIGDSDSGQVFPVGCHRGDDHAYLPALGSVLFNDSQLKGEMKAAEHSPPFAMPPELLWILGPAAVDEYLQLTPASVPESSQGFSDSGIYILRDRDLYLLFNASGAGINGRGSHGHNDALSIEVSACGVPFIVDPATYVYTSDLDQRHLFRSTAYHSTVQIDNAEQNTTAAASPFIIGDEAQPQVLEFELGSGLEFVSAEHYGYRRLNQPVIHQRRVVFNKERRYWFLSDRLTGEGEHGLSFRFHFAGGLETKVRSDGFVDVCDRTRGGRLLIAAYEPNAAQALQPELESRFSSRHYGSREVSAAAHWSLRSGLPFVLNFVIVPVCPGEDEVERLSSARDWQD
ncbi:MAG: alginate lyase family protein [Pyrinomonadaceae bacterium]